ncbi:EamA domain-containing protein [Entamoeba marina]
MVNKSLIRNIHIITGMLLFGTGSSVTMKVQLDMECTGYGGISHTFDKPFFQSIVMFFSMSLCFFIEKLLHLYDHLTNKEAKYDSLDTGEGKVPQEQGSVFVVLIPATFDLIASTIMTFGLIWTPVSVFQMLRGSMIIFSSILSRIFIGKKVRWGQLLGIVISFIALVMVGASAITSGQTGLVETTGFQTFVGICLILLAQLIQAGQIVAEEFFMKNMTLSPLKVVTFEGVFGLFEIALICCPLAYFVPGSDYSTMPHNSLENTIDSFICLFTSWQMILIMIIFAVSMMGLNAYGMFVTDIFNAVNRTILECIRTACVWVVMLILEVFWPGHGEKLTWWSILELAGFIVLFFATLTYNRVIKIPYLEKLDKLLDEEEKEKLVKDN